MEILSAVILLVVAFFVLGLLGWGLKALGWVFDFLKEGCFTSMGCIFWVLIILFLLIGLMM